MSEETGVPDGQAPAYVAVYELIDGLGDSLPRDVAERDALVLQAAEAAVWAFAGAENEGAWESFAPFVAKEFWEASMVTLGASLNFLNASNIDVAEPARPRPLRRRIERTGVRVQTIVVRPPGKARSKSAAARPIDALETPLSPVRGHWSHYGPRFNRGLLFGKHEGKFWVPAHARGAGEPTETTSDYLLKPRKDTAA